MGGGGGGGGFRVKWPHSKTALSPPEEAPRSAVLADRGAFGNGDFLETEHKGGSVDVSARRDM